MTLTPGTRLGAYEITEQIGAGGMGEVYRARDTRLKRDVAIKVLPVAMAADAERLARFQREAELLASLNHPNIAAIYGLEDAGGHTAIVMELVDGLTLQELTERAVDFAPSGNEARQAAGVGPRGKLRKEGGLPLDEVLPIAKQIADALEAAHEQGIVHRDLKPANVKVRPDGVVKVLDFGLAKALAPEGIAAADAMNSPTITSPAMTEAGMILGTAAYMAPEQARGRVVDRRADIWAFGVVVFEMLTGRRAFPGDNVTDTIVAVISKEPDWAALPPVPPSLRKLLERCLTKDPKARLRDIGEARVQIDELLSPALAESAVAVSVPVAPGPVARPTRSRMVTWTAAGIVVASLGISLWALWRANSAPAAAALRLTPLSADRGAQSGVVWSPDGKSVAFSVAGRNNAPSVVYVRDLDSPVARPIAHFPGALNLVEWISDGKILFSDSRTIYSVSQVGSEPELWATSSGSVSRDGAAAVRWTRDSSLSTFSRDSEAKAYEPAPFKTLAVVRNTRVHFSPDGKQILLLRNVSGAEAWLMPYPADAANPPHRILESLMAFGSTPEFSWMPDNRRVVVSTNERDGPPQLYMADTVSGAFALFSSGTTPEEAPAVSPDGNRLVFRETVGDHDIVTVNLTTAVVTPMIATQRNEQTPAWSSNGSAMVYVTDLNGGPEIWLHKPNQTDRPLVTARDFPQGTTRFFMGPSLSPDATRVIYRRGERARSAEGIAGSSILWMSAVAGGQPEQLVKTSDASGYPGSWSPDGNWFVYWSEKKSRFSLNKVKTTGLAEPVVLKADVNRSGGISVPVWSPTGEWILYEDNGAKLISPDGKSMRDLPGARALAYAFSVDGQTIYGLRPAGGAGELFSMSVAGGPAKVIGSVDLKDLPAISLSPALYMTLTPDGKSLTYSTHKTTSNKLWLMDGLKDVKIR